MPKSDQPSIWPAKLLHLVLKDCEGLCNKDVRTIVQMSPTLLTLTIGYNPLLTDDTLRNVGEHCMRLQRLDIQFCVRLTDAGFGHVVLCCTELRVVMISGCELVTDATLERMRDGLPLLQTIVASKRSCPQLTTSLIDEINSRR